MSGFRNPRRTTSRTFSRLTDSASTRNKLLAVIIGAVITLQPLLFNVPRANAQVSTVTLGVPYTQNFDTLPASGSATWTNNSTIPGWFHARTGTGTTIVANNGSSNAGNLYSYGTGTATDRALGSLGSGNAAIGNLFWGVRLQNNTGSTITQLDVSYTGEQWRNSAAAAQTVAFSYLVGSPTVTGSLAEFQSAGVAVPQLDFTSPITGGAAAALDGNLAANRVTLTHSITGLNIPNGSEVMLRWSDPDHTGADHGMSIDDFSVTAQGTVSPTPTLNISDVTMSEGDAGTTNFTFNVTLTSAAPVGGVTFDIATADGTAQDDNPGTEDDDYVAQSLTGQSIPATQTGPYQFTVQVNGDTDVEPNETFFVNVTNVTGANAGDTQGQGTITNDDVTLTLIHDVQGNGASSPLSGTSVTVRGIVTLLKSNGFFIQEEVADYDADPNTSEGIFVFTSSAPTVAVGDQATVTGTVAEFNGLTELTSPTVSLNSTGNTLPTAVTLDSTILDPTAAPTQPQLEKYEGMRMTGTLRTVAPNDNFYDVYTVLSSVARPMREPGIPVSDPIPPDPTSGLPDANIPIWDENPERLKVDTNGRASAPSDPYTSNVTFTGVTGPLDYSFGEYRLIPEAALTASANMTAVAVPTPLASEFTIASYNIENFNNNATQRQKAADTVRNLLHFPDIIGAVEIFDLADLQALRDQINNDAVANSQPNPMYEAYLVEQDGTSEDSDQDVGFLVKTSRVSVTSVTQEREEETYAEPGGGDPAAILHDRPPLVLDAIVDPSGANPRRVLVVVNHLRSFIDIELVAGDGPRVREKRKLQAESLADLLNDLQTANPGVPVISVGDYNEYEFSSGYDDSMSVIKGNPTADDQIVVDQSPDLVNPNLANLTEVLPAAERYSFMFEGTPQGLDHHVVNTSALARNTRIAIARVNSDFPEDPAATYASNVATPERNSDHDPVVSYYSLNQPQVAGSVIISEFRFRGPGSVALPATMSLKGRKAPDLKGRKAPELIGLLPAQDEFVEIYNNTDSPITVSTIDGSSGWALVAADGVTRFIIPNGTVIPARGHFLGVNTAGYSLADHGGPGAAAGDSVMTINGGPLVPGYTTDIPDGNGIALFRSANPANFTMAERLDAAGYASVDSLYREGNGIPTGGAETSSNLEHSFFRSMTRATSGFPKDTGDNVTDFIGVTTDGTATGLGAQNLGAPGPENLGSPLNVNATFAGFLLDRTRLSSQIPNRERNPGDGAGSPPTQFGTMTLRLRLVNNTGAPVSRVRFRIIEVTTFSQPGFADLRALTSSDTSINDIGDADTCVASGSPTAPCTVTVNGTNLETPPAQILGGGWNSTMSVTLGTPLPAGSSLNVQFRLGVQQTGSFRFFVNVEALP